MKTSTLVLAVIALCACSDHTYEAVGFFQFQTLAEETSVYDAIAKIAPKVGYSLETDMRKNSPERGASFAGLHFTKKNGKYLLTFSPTKGTACYFIQVDAYDKERAQKVAGDLPMLQDALRAELGKNLRYLGPGDCPRVQ